MYFKAAVILGMLYEIRWDNGVIMTYNDKNDNIRAGTKSDAGVELKQVSN